MAAERSGWTIRAAGDSALLLTLGDHIDESINRRVHTLATLLKSGLSEHGSVVVITAYSSLMISYDPLKLDFDTIARVIDDAIDKHRYTDVRPRRFVIPVRYGDEYGADLSDVAKMHKLTTEDVIELHANRDYPIYCIGFSPGFPYLGGLPEALHTPRLDTPRQAVPAGSVAIGGGQTGIYPTSMPGGWRLIGRTPLCLFDAHRDPPAPYRPADILRFEPVDHQTYEDLRLSRPFAEPCEL